METNKLIFTNQSKFELATNTFTNVPVILKYENVDLISIIKESTLAYTTKIPIFHSDGTHLADAKGSRLFMTKEGEKAGLKIEKHPNIWACSLDGKTVFEIRQKSPEFFKTTAELFTNDGYFVKCLDSPSPGLIDVNGDNLKIGGFIMSRSSINGFKTGIWIRKDGSLSIGVN
jgi:hypothetical protein